jgi:hypothetical protein
MITLQALQPDGTWATRNAFNAQNKLVACGAMVREDLVELAQAAARRWHATHDAVCTLRVHDDAVEARKAPVDAPTASRAVAAARLTQRWNEQCDMLPLMRADIPLDLYIRRNVAGVMARDGLRAYGS